MPNIRQVETPDLALRPDDRAMEATANSGRRIAGFYDKVASNQQNMGREIRGVIDDVGTVAVKHAEHQEISAGAAEIAKTRAGLNAQWNKTVKDADPNNPTLAAKFLEETVEPVLEKLKSGFMTEGGQRFAESQVQSFRNELFTKTSGDMATLAGVAAKKNIETLTNSLSNMAISDPSSLKTSLGLVEASVGAMVDSSPNLKGVAGAAMKIELTQAAQKEIVKAAAIGAINANPEAGVKQFSSPAYSKYISGSEIKQLEAHAKTVQRAQRVDENYRRTMEKQEKEERSDAREGEYLVKLHSGDPKEMAQVSARAIANDLTLTRPARERMIGIVERATEPEAPAKISNATTSDLIQRMRLPVGDPRRIDSLDPVYDEMVKGRLNKADLKFVREEFVNLRTPEGARLGNAQEEFIKSVKPLIDKSNPLLGKIDQSGPQQVYNFTMVLRRKVEEFRKAGKDPHDLMDPSKPDYMGTPAALAAFQKPLQESLADTARMLRANSGKPAPARNDVMPGIPPVSDRLPGSLYETPRGPMKWTGTGWVAP